jgi:hypothetical protein
LCDAEAEKQCDDYVAFLRKVHSRRIPQKQSIMIFEKKKTAMSDSERANELVRS